MAATNTALCLAHVTRHIWLDGWHDVSSQFLGLALTGFICWHASQGGAISTGLLRFFYGFGTAAFCLLLIIVGIGLILSVRALAGASASSHPFPMHFSLGFGHDDAPGDGGWLHNLETLGTGVWSAFSFWVLKFSKDARLYCYIRQLGLPEAAALEREWQNLRHAYSL